MSSPPYPHSVLQPGDAYAAQAATRQTTELARTEQELRDSEARTRLLLEAADVGLWDWDLVNNETYFSPEWKRQIGYRDDELPSAFAEWESRLHPDDRAATLAAVQAFREGLRPHYDVEFRLRHRDGSWRWIFARANFVRDAMGEPIRMLGSHTEITERKLAAEALRASEERFKYAEDATRDGIWDLNMATGSVYYSPQWERLLGYSQGEVPQTVDFFFQSVHPQDLAQVQQQMQDHMAGHTAIKQGEVRLRMKDGSYRWFLDRGKVVARDASGAPARMVGTITDIAERHQIEEALVASETMLRAIIDASPVPMALNDAQQNFALVNPAFIDAFGYAPSEIPTLTAWWARAYPNPAYFAQVAHDWQAELQRVKHSGTAFSPIEVSVRCQDGSTKTVLATASRLSNAHTGAHLVVMVDITAQKKAQVELSASVLEKEALLKEVHHRVKNNLQVITSLLRLESGRSEQPGTRAVLGEMQGRIRSMALLHESLYRSGVFASVDLGDYLAQLVTHAFRSQAQTNDAVRLVLALDPVHVGMDQATPCGLLVNELVSNCFKHGFPHGSEGEIRVELRAADDGRQLRLCVSDTGVGLPADFDAIRRQSLGLQLVEDLAAQIGGSLAVGPGSLFSVRFRVDDKHLSSRDALTAHDR